jgi:hypothetical protein
MQARLGRVVPSGWTVPLTASFAQCTSTGMPWVTARGGGGGAAMRAPTWRSEGDGRAADVRAMGEPHDERTKTLRTLRTTPLRFAVALGLRQLARRTAGASPAVSPRRHARRGTTRWPTGCTPPKGTPTEHGTVGRVGSPRRTRCDLIVLQLGDAAALRATEEQLRGRLTSARSSHEVGRTHALGGIYRTLGTISFAERWLADAEENDRCCIATCRDVGQDATGRGSRRASGLRRNELDLLGARR